MGGWVAAVAAHGRRCRLMLMRAGNTAATHETHCGLAALNPAPVLPRHMYGSVIAAFNDNRLDARLMRGCHQEVALHCGQHPARALECLRVRCAGTGTVAARRHTQMQGAVCSGGYCSPQGSNTP